MKSFSANKYAAVMAIAALLILGGCHRNREGVDADHVVFIDDVGRKVIVPKSPQKIMGASPVGTVLIYTLAPDMMIGFNYQPAPDELSFMPEKYRSLPVIGGWFGKNTTGNLEKITAMHPDLILNVGELKDRDFADRIQAQTHIPVIMLDGALEKLPQTYRRLGELTGDKQRAELLATYAEQTLREVSTTVAAIPIDKRRRYYYAEGPKGLETEPGGGMHSKAMDFCGGVNVASVPDQKGYGHTPASMEQLLQWQPDVILTGYDHTKSPGEFYTNVWSDQLWSRIRAVKNGDVYEAPQYPHSWIDRPPSANRLIGVKWLAQLFYPERFHYDMRAETLRFYELFYHVKLSDAQLNIVLSPATRRRK